MFGTVVLMPYKYLYYRIYSWNLRTWGESDVPEYNALFGVSFLAFLNIMSLFTAIELVTGLRIIDDSRMGKLFWFVAFLGVLVANYFLLVVEAGINRLQGSSVAKRQSKRELD